MAKIYRLNSEMNRSRSAIGGNSVTIANGDLVSLVGGFAVKAIDSTGRIEGASSQSTTFASDNQTVAKATLEYVKAEPSVEFLLTISGGTITAADEGKFYNLTSGGVVDGTSESTVGTVTTVSGNAETASATFYQLKLVKFISATSSVFVANNGAN